jgi:hypothetical protein
MKSASDVKTALSNIKADIAAINDLVSATLNCAILERADLSLNIGSSNPAGPIKRDLNQGWQSSSAPSNGIAERCSL